MPSFDVSAAMNWQELDNAIQQTLKEVNQRFDFKGVRSELTLDRSAKTVVLWCSEEGKLDALNDIFQTKLVKRGISLLALEYENIQSAFGGSVRQTVNIQTGISKDKAKKITLSLKDSKLKVQAQVQDEQVRVTGKSRDELQNAISWLKQQQDQLKIPLQFSNFRD